MVIFAWRGEGQKENGTFSEVRDKVKSLSGLACPNSDCRLLPAKNEWVKPCQLPRFGTCTRLAVTSIASLSLMGQCDVASYMSGYFSVISIKLVWPEASRQE